MRRGPVRQHHPRPAGGGERFFRVLAGRLRRAPRPDPGVLGPAEAVQPYPDIPYAIFERASGQSGGWIKHRGAVHERPRVPFYRALGGQHELSAGGPVTQHEHGAGVSGQRSAGKVMLPVQCRKRGREQRRVNGCSPGAAVSGHRLAVDAKLRGKADPQGAVVPMQIVKVAPRADPLLPVGECLQVSEPTGSGEVRRVGLLTVGG